MPKKTRIKPAGPAPGATTDNYTRHRASGNVSPSIRPHGKSPGHYADDDPTYGRRVRVDYTPDKVTVNKS